MPRLSRAPLFALIVAAGLAFFATAAAAEDSETAPVDVDAVVDALKSDEDAQVLAAAEQSKDLADDAVTKPLVKLLTNERFEIRAASIRALGARTTDKAKKEAAKALCSRLPKLAKSAIDEGELSLAVAALHELAQPSSIQPLLDKVVDTENDEIFRARVMAVANVPDVDAIDELIKLLAARGRGKWAGQKRSVVSALESATGEKLGGDPDEWRAWWKDAKKTFDFEAARARRTEGAEKAREREERKRDRKERRGARGDAEGGDGEREGGRDSE